MASIIRQTIADLSVLVWENAPQPDCLLVVLHSLGEDAAAFINLAPYFANHLPNVRIIAPDGPEAFRMHGEVAPRGRQWFDLNIADLQAQRFAKPDESTGETGGDMSADMPADMMAEIMTRLQNGVKQAHTGLAACLAECLNTFGIAPQRLMLFGFSQGGMMALHTGLRLPQPPAAIVSAAGALLLPSLNTPATPPPVLLMHGEADEVVPVAALDMAAASLKASGVAVECMRVAGLGHTIDEAGFAASAEFFKTHLPPSPIIKAEA